MKYRNRSKTNPRQLPLYPGPRPLERDHTLLYGSRIAGSLATHEVVALAKRHIDAAQQRLGTFAIQATAMFLHAFDVLALTFVVRPQGDHDRHARIDLT